MLSLQDSNSKESFTGNELTIIKCIGIYNINIRICDFMLHKNYSLGYNEGININK